MPPAPLVPDIGWPERKQIIELYKKMTESIRAFNSFLFGNSVGFPSLDSHDLSRDRMAAATAIGKRIRFLVLKGLTEAMLDRIDEVVRLSS